jgi:hypothetical protein
VILRQLYSQYSEGYEEAQRTYKECMQLKEFEQFMQVRARRIGLQALLKTKP